MSVSSQITDVAVQRSHHVWLLDRLASLICRKYSTELGTWFRQRLQDDGLLDQKENNALQTLKACGIPMEKLKEEWHSQVKSQTANRTCKLLLFLCVSVLT